jgi:diadenylate cyclase
MERGGDSQAVSSFVHNAQIFFSNVGWRDVVDVLITAFLLYQLLKLIRGTQAVQLLLGLGVLFFLGFISSQLHFRMLDFLFTNGSQAILLALIVLFQPELRRALDQVGRLSRVRQLVGHHGGVEIARVVEEVIRAASTLQERRSGALIVFERQTGLENVAITGVRVDGEVTAEMLVTIFFPNSPLHDGAAIIRDTRLVAAGCVLPLADAIPGVGRMGTRHRAALGLTLQSDAVVLIVSEETGLISVAHQGKIYRGLDQAKLHDMLANLLGAEPVTGRVTIPRPFLRTGALRSFTRQR